MLYNYILTAWKVFLRRKFFTFINLFGISLTLAVIMVASSIAESYLYPSGPEKNNDHYRIIDRLTLTNEAQSQTYGGRLGYKFIEDNILRLKTPEIISFNTGAYAVSVFKNENKLTKMYRRTDANYWKVFDFNFISGHAFDTNDVDSGRFVAVINQRLQQELFNQQSAIGQHIMFSNQRFEIIGVVENVSAVELNAAADIWVPYTTMPSSAYQEEFMGLWEAIVYHSDSSKLAEIHNEYVHLLKNDLIISKNDNMSVAYSGAYSKLEGISRRSFAGEYSYDTKMPALISALIGALILFMLLPSINMINLNVSRILERSSEIGVRKAFGASARQLVAQFIIESILITLVGGIIGIVISVFVLNLIETSGLIAYAEFSLNLRVLLWGFLMIILFGLISGVYPAIKMSRLNPVVALKGGE